MKYVGYEFRENGFSLKHPSIWGDSCKIAKVNIDDCRDLAVTYNVKSIPMLLFFKDGEVRDEVVGVINKETISSKLDAIAWFFV